MCRSTRRPLLCPNCVNRGHLNDLALRTARQHKHKLLERINRALEVQVGTIALHLACPFPRSRESRRERCTSLNSTEGCWDLMRLPLMSELKAMIVNGRPHRS